jgi:hypothetical protein
MRATGILLLPDEDLVFFTLAATATAWETVKRKVKDAQTNGFMSWEQRVLELESWGTSRFPSVVYMGSRLTVSRDMTSPIGRPG